MHIAICDDQPEQVQILKEQIKAVCAKRDYSVSKWSVYHSGEELLEAHNAQDKYDIIFLDVDMPGLSGMETAHRLRGMDSEALIIFVTSYLEYMRDAFRVEAFDYLVKPVHIRELDDLMKRCVVKYSQRYGKISVKTVQRETQILSCHKILCIQSRLHHIEITMTDGVVHAVLMKLSQIEEMLKPYSQFVRCHQSYMVNLDCVEAIQQNSFVINKDFQYIQTLIPISRKHLAQVKERYLNYHLM